MAEGDPIRIIPHSPKGIPDTGSFEVVHPGGREMFFWDDNAGRRSISKSVKMDREEALKAAQEFARREREKLG
jgi:hypothetical protein